MYNSPKRNEIMDDAVYSNNHLVCSRPKARQVGPRSVQRSRQFGSYFPTRAWGVKRPMVHITYGSDRHYRRGEYPILRSDLHHPKKKYEASKIGVICNERSPPL